MHAIHYRKSQFGWNFALRGQTSRVLRVRTRWDVFICDCPRLSCAIIAHNNLRTRPRARKPIHLCAPGAECAGDSRLLPLRVLANRRLARWRDQSRLALPRGVRAGASGRHRRYSDDDTPPVKHSNSDVRVGNFVCEFVRVKLSLLVFLSNPEFTL